MEVDNSCDENFIISKIKHLRENKDPVSARTWLITAKTLFPNSFNVQFEAYKLEREANNYEAAAKNLSYIILTFQSQTKELWDELSELTTALRAPENEITMTQEFYVKMFEHLAADVQHKILLTTVTQSESNLNQCKLLLIILKKFPQLIVSHSPRLLELITDGISQNSQIYQEMLMEEVIPLLYHKPPELSPALVCHLFTISLEYYLREIMEDKSDVNEVWKKIFQILTLCAKILRWETFLAFNKSWGHNIYWDKLIEIIAKSPGGSPQVLFYATTLFIYSLHCYIKHCNTRLDDAETNHVLVEGFTEWNVDRTEGQSLEPPQISVTTNASKNISKAFVHAAQCWQLLNTDQFTRDFSKLILALPLASWISRFLFDLAIYFGHHEEAKKLMEELNGVSISVHNLQILSLNMLQGALTLQGFNCILVILAELPTTPGKFMEHLTLDIKRHMIFIPLTQRALVQYCAKAIINSLSHKLYEPNCPDYILGDLLVLLQLDYPRETLMAEQIFKLIISRRSFSYKLFSAYIITIDFLEEFLDIWQTHGEEFSFDISNSQLTNGSHRRTRGTEKGVRDEVRMVIRQQVARANENITTLVANFITQEHVLLMQNMFGNETQSF